MTSMPVCERCEFMLAATREAQALGSRYADEVLTLRAALDELRADAERYRWLAAHCRSTAEHWGGRWSIVVEGPPPERHDDEEDFHVAIDAARAPREP